MIREPAYGGLGSQLHDFPLAERLSRHCLAAARARRSAWCGAGPAPLLHPRERGLIIADLLGGKENKNAGSYNREDCRRWSERYEIPMSYLDPGVFHERAKRWMFSSYDREELPARAFYAADPPPLATPRAGPA